MEPRTTAASDAERGMGQSRMKPHDERLVAERPIVGGGVLDPLDVRHELDPPHPPAERLQERAHHGAGVGGPEAEVDAEPERHVGIRPAVEPDLVGRLEHRLVEVGRRPAQARAIARRDGHAVHVGVDRTDAADVSQRHEHAKELLARQDDASGIGPEVLERRGAFGTVADGAGDRVDHRVAAPREHQVGEAELLGAGERPSPIRHPRQQAVEVVARRRGGLVELLVEIPFEILSLLRAVPPVMEDVHAPADEPLGLGLVHAEEHREGPRLQRQGEVAHHLDRVAGERLREQPLGDRLDPGEERGLLRPQEEGLDELAILGLLGRIGLDGQLPHRCGGAPPTGSARGTGRRS